MASLAHQSHSAARQRNKPRGHNPLFAPLLVFCTLLAIGSLYIGYILWPRWPEAPVARDAPSLPVVVAGTAFNIEPAAIRQPVQRKPGTQERIDLAYMWPSLLPPEPTATATTGPQPDPTERLFITIQSGEITLPLSERVETIYPRYLETASVQGPNGLTVRPFRDGTAYQGEDLVLDPSSPDHFTARCTRKGVGNSGSCLMERRVGDADITIRFPRDWLADWSAIAGGVDKLMARLAPQPVR